MKDYIDLILCYTEHNLLFPFFLVSSLWKKIKTTEHPAKHISKNTNPLLKSPAKFQNIYTVQ